MRYVASLVQASVGGTLADDGAQTVRQLRELFFFPGAPRVELQVRRPASGRGMEEVGEMVELARVRCGIRCVMHLAMRRTIHRARDAMRCTNRVCAA